MKLLLIGAASAAALAIAAPAAAQYPPPPPPPPDADQYGPQAQDQGAYDQGADQADQDAYGPQDMGPPDDQAGPPDDQADQDQAYDQGQAYDQDQGYDQGQPPMPDDQQAYAPPQDQAGYPPPPPSGQGYVPPSQDQYGPAEGGYAGPPPPPPNPYDSQRAGPQSYAAGAPRQRFEGGPTYQGASPGLADREDMLGRRIQRLADRGLIDPRSAHDAMRELRAIEDEQTRLMQSGSLGPADEQRLSQQLNDLGRRVRAMRTGGPG